MDSLGLPKFGPEQLKDVEVECINAGVRVVVLICTSDFDMKTPGAGLMTINAKLWGPDPVAAQMEFLKRFVASIVKDFFTDTCTGSTPLEKSRAQCKLARQCV